MKEKREWMWSRTKRILENLDIILNLIREKIYSGEKINDSPKKSKAIKETVLRRNRESSN